MRQLDIGVASYGASHKLTATLHGIARRSTTDFRCFVIDNPGPDAETRRVIAEFAANDHRFIPVLMDENVGYAGAVNKLFELASTEYIAYLDNDVQMDTPAWDEKLCFCLDRFHEVGMVFPNGGAYQMDRGPYLEIMWGVGFAWVLNRLCLSDVGKFDAEIGHQNECDYALRVRMAGWKCAALPEVSIGHDATATNNPESIERINRGVIQFVDKWNRYFNGKNFSYHSPNVTRWEDWPPNALYLEKYWKQKPELKGLNDNPQVVHIDGRPYDLLKVPRLSEFYRERVI